MVVLNKLVVDAPLGQGSRIKAFREKAAMIAEPARRNDDDTRQIGGFYVHAWNFRAIDLPAGKYFFSYLRGAARAIKPIAPSRLRGQ